MTLFYASICVYGFSYLGEEISFVTKPIYLILSLFGVSWFRLPYSIKFGKKTLYAVSATIFDMIGLIYAGVQNAYYIYQNRIIPFYLSIPLFCLVCLILPLHYNGTLFNPDQTIQIKQYLLLIFEIFMNYSFISAICTMKKYWIFFICAAWRLFVLFEPYGFWATLHTFVSPYRAFARSLGARSLIVIFLLHVEYFLVDYCAIWFMKKTVINKVITYFCLAYFILYLLIEIFAPGFPYTHKVKSISTAKTYMKSGPAVM